jgi:hypothetical protein
MLEMIPVRKYKIQTMLKEIGHQLLFCTLAGGDVPFPLAWFEACTSSLDCIF